MGDKQASDKTTERVPPGFERLPPCYRQVDGDAVSFGLAVEPQHSNTMGICHGGVLMTLADITAATAYSRSWGRSRSPSRRAYLQRSAGHR